MSNSSLGRVSLGKKNSVGTAGRRGVNNLGKKVNTVTPKKMSGSGRIESNRGTSGKSIGTPVKKKV